MAFDHYVVRDRFFYTSNGFLALSVDGQLRPRQSSAELKTHFLSLLADGTGDDRNNCDHWYEAQLRHYGLDVPKAREATSKDRLREAVLGAGQDGLAVPAHILALEQEMMAEWEEAKNKKGKAPESRAAVNDEEATEPQAEEDTGLIIFPTTPAARPQGEGLPRRRSEGQVAQNRGRHRSRLIGADRHPAGEVARAPSPGPPQWFPPPSGELFPNTGIVATDFEPRTAWLAPCWSGDTNSFSDSEIERRGGY